MRSEWLKFKPETDGNPDPLLSQFEELWREAASIWDQCERDSAFARFVAADYRLVFRSLLRYRDRFSRFLEWGSGTGVTTIMAGLMGYEAYGIEIEPGLIQFANKLAKKYRSPAVFVEGSFIPDEYDWNAEFADENFRSRVDGRSGYDELDLELRDFDLIYGYPWPDEETFFHDILKQCGSKRAVLLTFNVREGMKATRRG